jgi:glycogen(starch) synthase
MELFWPHIGGVEIFSHQLMSALQRRGYKFSVITSASDEAGAGEDEVDGIQIYRFHFQRMISEKDLKKIQQVKNMVLEVFEQVEPHLVHLNTCQPSLFFYSLVANSLSFPYLFTVHGLHAEIHRPNSLVERSLRAADWVTAVSQASLLQAQRLVPEITPRASVIYNGLPMPSEPVRDLPFNHPTLLCVGRVVEPKGFDLAIQALSEIRATIPDARLVIAGDGPEKPALEQLAAALGLDGVVDFLGWCAPDSIPALIDGATVVVIPSRDEESFGLVALQAAQRSRPVVASRLGGLPEVVVHQETGLLFEEGNLTELTQKVLYLLRHPQVAFQMGRASRTRAEQKFSIEAAANAYHNLYQQLCRPTNGGTS